jgi:hypothetical protein
MQNTHTWNASQLFSVSVTHTVYLLGPVVEATAGSTLLCAAAAIAAFRFSRLVSEAENGDSGRRCWGAASSTSTSEKRSDKLENTEHTQKQNKIYKTCTKTV